MVLDERFKNLREMLERHEGFRPKPYRCTEGKLTIGIGRNLEDVGITKDEARVLLSNDIERCIFEASKFPWFNSLSSVRQDVVLSMLFNMGLAGFLEFRKMIDAINRSDYETAANEMIDSDWRHQVGMRAVELSQMMRSGRYLNS